MYPTSAVVLSKGGVKSQVRSWASRTRFSSSDRSATPTRSESPAPEIAAQVCGSESMRASAFSLDPRGVPSSKYARRYHAPSQAWASIVCASSAARGRHACPSSSTSREVSNSAKSPSTQISNQASQTLSPLPPSPTRLRPSFQSPPPISGSPCGPAGAERAMGRPGGWSGRPGGRGARAGPPAMFEQRTLRGGNNWNGKALRLLLLKRFAFEEGNHPIEDRGVASRADVVRGDERKPEQIIADPRAGASA